MRDFILVGRESTALWYLANKLNPKLVIVETKTASNKFILRKLLSMNLLSVIMNLWLRWRFDNYFSFNGYHKVKYVDRIKSKDVMGESVLLFGSSIIRKKTIGASKTMINLHLGILPAYRGCKAEVWALSKKDLPGYSLHYVTPEIDKGKVILCDKIVFKGNTIIKNKVFALILATKCIKKWFDTGAVSKNYLGNDSYYSTPGWKTIIKAWWFCKTKK